MGVRLPVERIKRIGLRGSFFLLALCGLAVSLVLLALLWQGCGAIAARYSNGGYIIGPGGLVERLPSPSPEEARLLELLGDIKLAGCIILPLLGLAGAGALFYRWKLKRPIALLMEGTRRIQAQDLDFSIPQPSRDELGQLCAAFETMRAQLLRTNRELWRQGEERKRLNAAFAHDLRTPLTVLKGYNEMLQASGEEQTRTTAITMGRHIARLEQYVSTMSQLRRLEDTRPNRQPTALAPLAASLAESGEMVCTQAGKGFSMEDRTGSQSLTLDGAFVAQVFGNLVANAARYAKNTVSLTLAEADGGLLLTMTDDGPGFAPEALEKAAAPYFTGEKGSHFGLGLYICTTLCRHHDGWLKVENGPAGAKATAFFGTNAEIR